jgi:hypothetical protein
MGRKQLGVMHSPVQVVSPSNIPIPLSVTNNHIPATIITSTTTRVQMKRFNADSRYVVTEWMYQVCERIYKERGESRMVFHTSVHALDKVLSNAPVLASSPEFSAILQSEAFLQLSGLCCVVLAIDYLKNRNLLTSSSPRAESMLGFCGTKYSADQFSRMLGEIVRFEPLENLTTSVQSFQELVDSNFISPTPAITNLALVLADSYILDYPSFKHSSRDIALCAYWVAKKIVEKDTSPPPSSIDPNSSCFQEVFYVAYLLFKDDIRQNSISPSASLTPI